MRHLIKFLKETPNWRETITAPPYSIKIKDEGNLTIFNYNQIESDMYNPIVQACRGSIINTDAMEPICVSFRKFGNYGEGYADTIDWTTAKAQEKLDGSIIKLWYNVDKMTWQVSTNATIDAKNAQLGDGLGEYKTFYDLFVKALLNYWVSPKELPRNYTFIFELMSPYNQIVVPHDKIKLAHLTTFNNLTYEEIECPLKTVPRPKEFLLSSLEECIVAANELPFSEEGYVVVDGNYNRIKVKSPAYVAAHHLHRNGSFSRCRAVILIMTNELEEYLTYFPYRKDEILDVQTDMEVLIKELDILIQKYTQYKLLGDKDFAKMVEKEQYKHILFLWRNGRIQDGKDWVFSQRPKNIAELLYGKGTL